LPLSRFIRPGREPNGSSRLQASPPLADDAYCPELRLVIEVDGPIHAEQILEDKTRERDLARLGLHILRIQASQVMDDILAVFDRIAAECLHRATTLVVPLRDG
jgi:very-short-patch-repair endonuclease